MNYDEVYARNPDYFGKPFPELIDYFRRQPKKSKLLDVGCGQGRNAIPLAEMGYDVTAIDTSPIAIDQLSLSAKAKSIDLKTVCSDFIAITDLEAFDFVLLDGFFHFYDHERSEDVKKMHHLLATVRSDCKLVFCFADHGDAVSAFRQMTDKCALVEESNILYEYTDPVSEWKFETQYFFASCRKKL